MTKNIKFIIMRFILFLFVCVIATVTAENHLTPFGECDSLARWFQVIGHEYPMHKIYLEFVQSLCEKSEPHFCQCPNNNVEKLFTEYWKSNYGINEDDYKKIHYIFRTEKCGIGRPFNINGSSIKPTDLPWLALLEYETSTDVSLEPGCGGVLISEDTVLTAARCLDIQGTVTHVRLGEYNIYNTTFGRKSNAIRVPVANVIVHEDYYSDRNEFHEGFTNDIAVIKLANKVESNDYVSPICLPIKPAPENDYYFIGGWGIHTDYTRRATNVKIASASFDNAGDDCGNSHELNYIANVQEHICISSAKPGKEIYSNPCIGDSGGPLMTYDTESGRYMLQGISALTLDCSKHVSPYGLYTRVFEFLPWIQKFIK